MSRSGYTEEGEDNWQMIMWRGSVVSAMRGKRGQRLLRELAASMDAMPEKVLIANDLEKDGCHCALGVVGAARGIDLAAIDPDDSFTVAQKFDSAEPLAQEIVFQNDEAVYWEEPPAQRWTRMRAWVQSKIVAPPNSVVSGLHD